MNIRGQISPGPAESLVRAMPSRQDPFPWNSRRTPSSPGGMLVGQAGCRVNADHAPLDTFLGVGVGLDGTQDVLPGAARWPAPMPVMAGLPLPEARRHVAPGDAGAPAEENAVDHLAMTLPPPAPSHVLRKVQLQLSPLRVRRIAPPHTSRNDLANRRSHDPSDTRWAPSAACDDFQSDLQVAARHTPGFCDAEGESVYRGGSGGSDLLVFAGNGIDRDENRMRRSAGSQLTL